MKRLTILSVGFLICFSLVSYGQRGMPPGLSRFEIGISYPMVKANFHESYKVFDYISFENKDTTLFP